MTPNEFVVWLRGFSQAANNFTLTPKQWDDIKENLDKVELNERLSRYTLDKNATNWNTSNTISHMEASYENNQPTTKTLLTDNKV